jgi:HD-GYP domain-containing protein (c-di-GMP phosphodiesterase class II)
MKLFAIEEEERNCKECEEQMKLLAREGEEEEEERSCEECEEEQKKLLAIEEKEERKKERKKLRRM